MVSGIQAGPADRGLTSGIDASKIRVSKASETAIIGSKKGSKAESEVPLLPGPPDWLLLVVPASRASQLGSDIAATARIYYQS
jgi:hypothetical protein